MGGGTVTVLSGSITSNFLGIRHRFTSRRGVPLLGQQGWLLAVGQSRGKALERDGQITDASEKELITEDGFYVLADHKEHNWLAGRCACGREHTDHKWEDGKCTVCHLTCSPRDNRRGRRGKTCGTQFTAKANHDYYKHLSDALASENVDDVTLLADDTLSTDVRLERDIMFFPNGHTVSGGGSIVVPSGKRLTFSWK